MSADSEKTLEPSRLDVDSWESLLDSVDAYRRNEKNGNAPKTHDTKTRDYRHIHIPIPILLLTMPTNKINEKNAILVAPPSSHHSKNPITIPIPPPPLKMFLPKPKPHIPPTTFPRRLPDIPCGHIRPTEINTHISRGTSLQATHITPIQNPIAHSTEQLLEIRPSEIGTTLQFRQRIDSGADTVEVDIGAGILVHALGEVGVDAEELGVAVVGSGGGGLGLEGGQQGLEPLEAGGVAADPDELDAAEALGRVRAGALVPDVLEDAGPGGDADAGADEHGDLVLEHVFGRGAVGAVDPDGRHGLSRV